MAYILDSDQRFFVDEAGDASIFDRRGRVMLGQSGCSRFFILGFLQLPGPERLQRDLNDLRTRLLTDPYFANIPSMQPAARKTAQVFHATDDIPEVRWQVFQLLRAQSDLRFLAVVRDKQQVLSYVRQRNETDTTYHYHPNELYDYLVRRLFVNSLHKAAGYEIVFARRGKSDRTEALDTALAAARRRFTEKWGKSASAPILVKPAWSYEYGGLQAVDYFLWAVQRLYERGDDHYVQYVNDSISLIHDLDDTRAAQYGAYYTKKKPLTRAALEGRI